MKPSSFLRARLFCFVSAQAFLLPCILAVPSWAQDKAAAAATSVPAKTQPATPVLISMTLRDTTLRNALVSLVTKTNKVQDFVLDVDDNVPNTPLTLSIRDKTFDDAIRILLQHASTDTKKLIYTKTNGELYVGVAPAVTEPLRTDSIHLSSVRASDVMGRLQTAFPTSLILPGGDASSLLVRGSAQQNQDVRELVSLLDTVPRTVVLRAEVVLAMDGGSGAKASAGTKTSKTTVSGGSRSTLLSTTLRTLTGQEATGDDKIMGSPAQSAKLQLNATPVLLGDVTFQVDTRWEVSLPLPTGKTSPTREKGAGIVRLEKRLTTTTRLKNGETVLVGSVLLSQYGLKGEVLFFVTVNAAIE